MSLLSKDNRGKMDYNTIKEKIASLGTKVVGAGLGIALGVLISGYLPKPEPRPQKPQEVITIYKDTNQNGLYDTVVREFPNGQRTEKRLGWVEVVYDEKNDYKIVDHFREVSKEDILREQVPTGLEEIVIEE